MCAQVLARYLLPGMHEDAVKVVDHAALQTAMHVAPSSHLLGALDVVVGHVHSSCVGHVAVDDHNLAVVARPDMIDPRKADGVELIDVDAVVA